MLIDKRERRTTVELSDGRTVAPMTERGKWLLRFSLADVECANAEWRCNCGPAALAAICGLTLDEVRALFGPNWPGYTNPTAMFAALRASGATHHELRRTSASEQLWPHWGLCRIQWDGPWMARNVPAVARYQRTHWVGVSRLILQDGTVSAPNVCIWDVNQLGPPLNGDGWAPLAWWRSRVVPRLTSEVRRATGGWHITHAIEVERT